MLFLVGQISFFLFVAAMLGFLIGWFLKRYYMKQAFIRESRIWKANLYSKDEEISVIRDQLESCRNRLKESTAS